MRTIMNIGKRLKVSRELKASTAYMLCSILQRSISILSLPLFTRILTTEEYGLTTVYQSTQNVLIIFTSLNLPYGSFSPAMMKFEKDRDGYMSAVCTICTLLTGIYFIVYFSLKELWTNLLDLPTLLMVGMGFEMLMTTAQQFWMGKLRFEYKYKPFFIYTLFSSISATLFSLLAVVCLSEPGVYKVFVHGLVLSVFGFAIFLRIIIRGRQCFNTIYWKYALSFNIPLIPYYLSQVIFNQSDRLMINRMCGRSDAAIYGVAYTIALSFTFVINAINNSFVPWIYRKIKEGNLQENGNVSVIISAIMAVFLLIVIGIGPEIILIIAGEQYAQAVWIIPPVAMSLLLLFYSQLFINIEFYYEEKYKLVWASILAAVSNIVMNYFGIKIYGFIAAGYTTLISYMIFAFCNYVAMNKVCKKNGLDYSIYNYRLLFLIFLGFIIIGFGFEALYPYRFLRLCTIGLGLIIAIVMKSKLIECYRKIKADIYNDQFPTN